MTRKVETPYNIIKKRGGKISGIPHPTTIIIPQTKLNDKFIAIQTELTELKKITGISLFHHVAQYTFRDIAT